MSLENEPQGYRWNRTRPGFVLSTVPQPKLMALACLVAAFPAISSADIQSDVRSWLMDDYVRANTGGLALRLTGTRTVGSNVVNLYGTLAFRIIERDGRFTAQVETNYYENGVQVQRVVGDGQYFFAYDVARNRYVSVPYGSLDTLAQRPDHVSRLCQALRRNSSEGMGALAQIAEDMYIRGAVKWQPIMPTASLSLDPMDPLVVRADATTPVPSRTTYVFRTVDAELQRLSEILHIADNGRRRDDWRIQVWTGEIFDDTSFVFRPPVGSQAVTSERG